MDVLLGERCTACTFDEPAPPPEDPLLFFLDLPPPPAAETTLSSIKSSLRLWNLRGGDHTQGRSQSMSYIVYMK